MGSHFKIVIPLYNVEKWIKFCIRSVKAQSYRDFQCILVDDISTDSSAEVIKREIANDSRFILKENTEKAFALKNIYDGISLLDPDDNDIIVTLDGDDWLADKDVLKKLDQVYSQGDCWMTYGSYAEYPSNRRGKFAKQIPLHVIHNSAYRNFEWCSSHLRTFQFHLWNRIEVNDLLDTEGNFYRMAWDLAFMLPMLEMSAHRAKYISDILYVYNLGNPLNDHKIDNSYQRRLEMEIRNKPKYDKVAHNQRAATLMNHRRFDIAAKTIFATHESKNTGIEYHKEIYLAHLKVWNDLKENSPVKNGEDDFINSFKETINSIDENGFDGSVSKVPTLDGSLLNGAHRVASCIVLDKEIKVTEQLTDAGGQYIADYNYFRGKTNFVETGLNVSYCDEMALEFCRRKDNLYTISLFPSHEVPTSELLRAIRAKHPVIYEKNLELTENGKLNYVHNLYHNESWVGTKRNGLPGVREKSRYCFTKGNNVHLVLIQEDNFENLLSLKDELRAMCGVGKHSVHINDTQEETWRIASSGFNNNSIHFLNNKKFSETPNFDVFFERFHSHIRNREDYHDFCVDSSATLSAYGLRDCRDLDFLHLFDMPSLSHQIDCHNDWAHHYRSPKNEIIYNPDLHFYFHGVKFASLDVVLAMKQFRDEEKDRRDVQLMENL